MIAMDNCRTMNICDEMVGCGCSRELIAAAKIYCESLPVNEGVTAPYFIELSNNKGDDDDE